MPFKISDQMQKYRFSRQAIPCTGCSSGKRPFADISSHSLYF